MSDESESKPKTLRDEFAIALAPAIFADWSTYKHRQGGIGLTKDDMFAAVRDAWAAADMMLEERAKQ